MVAVGLRELKTHLSKYVRLARRGTVIQVTDRGEVVAELTAPGGAAVRHLPPGLAAMVRRGELIPGKGHDPSVYQFPSFHLPPGTAARLIDEDRGER